MASTASGTTAAYYLKLARVKVGAIELTDVDASVIDGDFPRETLLGMSFLNHVEMKRENDALRLIKKP